MAAVARRQKAEFSANEPWWGRTETDKSESGDRRKQEKEVSAPAASGLYFPRHSDFILATNKERALCVSMVTPSFQAVMERIKGQERKCILASGKTFFKFFRV